MNQDNKQPEEGKKSLLSTAVDLTVKIGTLLLIIFLCFKILMPFVSILLWALIIAIILAPVYERMGKWFGGRKKLSALVIALIGLAILLVPSYLLVDSIVVGLRELGESFREGTLDLPPPPASVAEWPLIGEWLYGNWVEIHEDLTEAVRKYMPQLRGFGEKVLNSLAGTGLGILQFALSIIIASVMLTYTEKVVSGIDRLFIKLAGDKGLEYAEVIDKTVRNVATGVLGVAIIQTTLFGAAMIFSGVPLAGFWILICLIIAIIQIPMIIVSLPLVIYSFATKEPLPAILWSLVFLVIGGVDNFLKPLIMGAGASVPMLVIFLGALGGFIAYGFLGLFFGAFVVSLGYKLYQAWLDSD
jgi:predicted PurR-regulated permease PerM